jgi:hypothetical protein
MKITKIAIPGLLVLLLANVAPYPPFAWTVEVEGKRL